MADTAIATVKNRYMTVAFAGNGALWNFVADTNVPVELRNLGKINVQSITFIPTAANDKCVITEGPGSGGPVIYEGVSIQTTSGVVVEDRQVFPRGQWMCPYFDLSKSTLGTPANAVIIFELL
jgi:hypothetical protein